MKDCPTPLPPHCYPATPEEWARLRSSSRALLVRYEGQKYIVAVFDGRGRVSRKLAPVAPAGSELLARTVLDQVFTRAFYPVGSKWVD